MKLPRLTRRRFLCAAALLAPAAAVADSRYLEPGWLKVKRLSLASEKPAHRLVHFTDLHHKGESALLKEVVSSINALRPDFVCFTGDIVEEARFLSEALEILSGIQA